MDCEVIQRDLAAYHFGGIEDDARRQVEEHLLACPRCLRDFLAIKREVETSPSLPSSRAKERLRKAVLLEIESHQPSVGWSWWERPLAVAFAGAAVFGAVLTVHTFSTAQGSAPREWVAPSTAP